MEYPKCTETDVQVGNMRALHAGVHMFSADNPRGLSSPITAKYCGNCGYILEMYVEQPQDLKVD